jgi:cytochrome P450
LAKRVLNKNEEFVRNDMFRRLLTGVAKYALFLIPDSRSVEWRQHRKFLQPGFGPTHLRHSVQVTNDVMDVFEQSITGKLSAGEKVRINVHEFFSGLGLDVMYELLMISKGYSLIKNKRKIADA